MTLLGAFALRNPPTWVWKCPLSVVRVLRSSLFGPVYSWLTSALEDCIFRITKYLAGLPPVTLATIRPQPGSV